MLSLTLNLYYWCLSQNVYGKEEYIQGTLNVHEDRESRIFIDSSQGGSSIFQASFMERQKHSLPRSPYLGEILNFEALEMPFSAFIVIQNVYIVSA